MIINELFDRTVEWKWVPPTMFKKEAEFIINDIYYLVGFSPYTAENEWMTGFAAKINGQWVENEIGNNSGLIVLSTVIDIITDFINTNSPDLLMLGAVPSRKQIYTRLLKYYEGKINAAGYVIGAAHNETVPIYGDVVIFDIQKVN